mgnify:FL=1
MPHYQILNGRRVELPDPPPDCICPEPPRPSPAAAAPPHRQPARASPGREPLIDIPASDWRRGAHLLLKSLREALGI